MNAALHVIAAEANGIKITGIRKGYKRMIDGDFLTLNINHLQKMVHRGGTLLRTARSQLFLTLEGRQLALKHLQENNINALIAIGDDGTFKGLLAFSDHQAFF
ncbi:MAG: 6-phosphofructokinase [Flavobacterium sp.]|nr:6-phosphofructokinase [Flavobacterium sp.]